MGDRRTDPWTLVAGALITAIAAGVRDVGGALGWTLGLLAAATVVAILVAQSRGWYPIVPRSRKQRLVKLATRVKWCDAKHRFEPDFRLRSSYGLETDMARHLVASQRPGSKLFQLRCWARPPRYTNSLHRQVEAAIEELGRAGQHDDYLARFLYENPGPDDLYDLAIKLNYLASRLDD